MKHKINLVFDRNRLSNVGMALHLRRCISGALDYQSVDVACEINVLITDDEGIRAINLAQREIDRATDVLSFPMFNLTAGELPQDWEDYIDPDTGRVPLGDMAISLEHAVAQGREFGHGLKRELGYLTVHSILHLLGYDHLDEGPMKKQMRTQEEAIMAQLMLPR